MIINFETIPGGSPADGMTISTQFQTTNGVTFSLEGGGFPVLAEVGPPRTAFEGFMHFPDQPAPGVNSGRFFLTDDGLVGGPPAPFIVGYSTPMANASGLILDIDGTEAWRVEARNASGSVIDTVGFGPDNLLDGSAVAWSFNHTNDDIDSVRLIYTGTSTAGVGVALDNFDQSSVVNTPEPSTAVLLISWLLAAIFWKSARKAARRPSAHEARTGGTY